MKKTAIVILWILWICVVPTQSNSQRYNHDVILGRGIIRFVKISPNEERVAISTNQGLWIHTKELEDVIHFSEHSESITAVTWSNTGNFIASGDNGGNIKVWDLLSQTLIHSFEVPPDTLIETLLFSPDEEKIGVETSEGRIYIYNLRTQQIDNILNPQHGSIVTFSWSPNGTYLVTSGIDQNLVFYDAHSFDIVESLETQFTRNLLWYSDESHLIAFSGQALNVFDMNDRRVVKEIVFDKSISFFEWIETENKIIAIDINNSELLEISLNSNEVSKLLTYESHIIPKAIFKSDNLLLVKLYGALAILDISTGDIVHKIEVYYTEIIDADWNDTGKLIGTTHAGGTFLVWDVETKEVVFNFQTDMETPFVRWEQYIAVANNDVYILSRDNYALVQKLEDGQFPISWNKEGTLLATQAKDENGVFIFNTISNSSETLFAEQCEHILDIAWNTEGNLLALDCGTLHVYDVSEEPILLWKTQNATNGVIWNPDDTSLLSFSAHSQLIRPIMYNSQNGEILQIFDPVTQVDWQPNGEYLLGSLSEGSTSYILIINSETSEVIERIDNKSDYITLLKWSKDGTKFVSIDSNQVIKIWAIE